MPSRDTSAFQNTVRHVLRERASDYTMWVAGHGGDSPTLTAYLDALAVFPSHFDEWAGNKNRTTLMEAIPALRSLLPSLFSDKDAVKESLQPIDPLPPVVSLVITLALQQYMMAKNIKNPEFGVRGTISGHHCPTIEVAILRDMINLNMGGDSVLF